MGTCVCVDPLPVTAIKYALFAAVSILVNLLFQYLGFLLYSGAFALYVAMSLGTLVGLVTKYVLDKQFIFDFQPKNSLHDAKHFFYYSVTGGFTTALFWAFEIGADLAFDNSAAKYVGALLGLTVGYTCKYFLDSRFVFRGYGQ